MSRHRRYSKKPIFVLDIDGVLADFVHGLQQRIGPPDDPSVYSLTKAYPKLKAKEIRAHVDDPDLYTHLPVVLGAKKAVKWLYENGFKLVAVTGRPDVPGMQEVTKRWISRQFGKYIRDVQFVDSKDKAFVLAQMDVGIAVDDNPNTVRQATQMGVRCVLFDQIYNWNDRDLPRMLSWNHLIKALKEEAR